MKTALCSLFLLLASLGFGQGNLQFNQVLTFAGMAPWDGIISLGTVPSNKVWKIEAHTISEITIYINGYTYNFLIGNAGGLVMNEKPIWLKAGDIVALQAACCSPKSYFFSIVEFNIVP